VPLFITFLFDQPDNNDHLPDELAIPPYKPFGAFAGTQAFKL
jgi:hypothetical protein